MEVSNYMKDGMITDWDMFEQFGLYETDLKSLKVKFSNEKYFYFSDFIFS